MEVSSLLTKKSNKMENKREDLWSPFLVIELTTPSSLTTPSPIKVTFMMLSTMTSEARNGAYTSSALQSRRNHRR
jgi:hypothetical protein